MSQAPPTPPPTGAAELMQVAGDAGAVDTTSVAAPTTTAPAAPPNTNTDPYRQSLSLITDLVASTNYDEVIRVAELGDLNVSLGSRTNVMCLFAYSTLVITPQAGSPSSHLFY